METHRIREPLTDDERATFQGYAAAIFSRMGMNFETPGTHDTPERWLAALWDMTEGYDGDAKLSTLFPVECPVCPDEEKTHCRRTNSLHWSLRAPRTADPRERVGRLSGARKAHWTFKAHPHRTLVF